MIRSLNENDVDEFIKIRGDSLMINPNSFGADPNEPIDCQSTLRNLQSKHSEDFALGYFEGNKIIGLVGFLRFSKRKIQHKGIVWGMFVYPEKRGLGIGKKLLLELINRAQEIDGLQKIMLSATHVSKAALSLYEHLGFEKYGVEKEAIIFEGEAFDEIFMELKLSKK